MVELLSTDFRHCSPSVRDKNSKANKLVVYRCISPGNASSRMNTLFDVAWTRKSSHNNVEKLLLKWLISGKTRWRNVFFDVTSSRGKRNKLCAWRRSKRRLLCLKKKKNYSRKTDRWSICINIIVSSVFFKEKLNFPIEFYHTISKLYN